MTKNLSTVPTWSDEISYDADPTPTPVATSVPVATPTVTPVPVARTPKTPKTPKASKTPRTTKTDQNVERVDAVGAARATEDERVAKSVGFSPEPPVYQIGTVVNETGVENFRASRADWANLPSLPELDRTFTAQIEAERRTDRQVSAAQCMMTTAGEFCADGITHTITERAIVGLATHVTPGGASYLRACPTELRAVNLNHWLSNATQRQTLSAIAKKATPKAKQMTLRTRIRGTRPEVYAVTGPKYAPFNVDRVLHEAAAGIGGDARGSITYDGYRMSLDALFHSNIAPENAVAGEFFKGCVRISAADDGSGSVKIKLGLWRNLCRNLIIVDFDTVLIGSRRHVGATTIESDVRELMSSASDRIALVVAKWSEASTEDVLARYDLQNVDEVFRGLVVNDCVRAVGVTDDDMVARLHTAWEREPGYSKTSILNAITRAAHESTWSSWADQEELESQAGELLYQQVWNLDRAEQTAEQILA